MAVNIFLEDHYITIMMSIKQWLMLWLIFIGYLFLGAFVFYSIERRYEEYRRVDDNPEKLNIEGSLIYIFIRSIFIYFETAKIEYNVE